MVRLYGDVSACDFFFGFFHDQRWFLSFFFFSADPELTPVGVDQARDIHERWETEASFGFPAPHVRYCSPMIRALHTAEVIFDGTYESYPSRVTVKEVRKSFNGPFACQINNNNNDNKTLRIAESKTECIPAIKGRTFRGSCLGFRRLRSRRGWMMKTGFGRRAFGKRGRRLL